MGYFEKNVKILETCYPGMALDIEQAEEKSDEKIEEQISQDYERILQVVKAGKKFYLGGKRNAKQPPYEWLLEQGELPEGFTFIMFGMGNVLYLKELIEHVNVRLNIVVYEPSIRIFKKSLDMIDLDKGMQKHLIIFWVEGLGEMTLGGIKPVLSPLMAVNRLSYVQLFVLPNYEQLFSEQCEELIKICEGLARAARIDYNTRVNFSYITAMNAMKNARYLCNGYKTVQLADVISSNIPAILVAAGPSLNKNIKWLKRAKNRAFIMAVDTALKPLLKEGIIPDMFFCVDAEKPLELFQMEGVEQIPMVSTLNASPDVLAYHKGKKFFYNQNFLFAEKILMHCDQRHGSVDTGGSVATNAFSLLFKVGIETIILVGQDLALTGNRTHADGTFEDKMKEIDVSDCKMVEGNCEELVPTRTDFIVFRDWYIETIRRYKEYDPVFRVINATEGGAKIEGTEVITLKQAIEQECTEEVDIKACIDSLKPMLDEEGQQWAREYLSKIPDEFDGLKNDAQKLRKSYQKLQQMCGQRKLDAVAYEKLLNKIRSQAIKIEKNDIYQLVIETIPSALAILREEEYREYKSVQKEGLIIAEKGMKYVDLVCKTADLLQAESKTIFEGILES